MYLKPVTRNVETCGNPRILMGFHMVQKTLQGECARGTSGETAMQANRHHAPPFLIQHIERIPQVAEELLAFRKPVQRDELHVVHIEGVGHNQLRLAVASIIIRQVIRVGIRIVKKASFFHDETPGIGLVRP